VSKSESTDVEDYIAIKIEPEEARTALAERQVIHPTGLSKTDHIFNCWATRIDFVNPNE